MADAIAGKANERTARILVIQDEAGLRAQVASSLRGAGFEVVEANSGISGIEAATACQPDLLLVDLHLPDLDGSEVASKLRHLGMEGLPIVAIGKPGEERGLALSAGCDGTISSPPDLEKLPGQVREFLAGKRDKLKGGDEKRYLRVLNQSLVEKLESNVRELTAANERLRQTDAFKTEFMESISHELSTPLTPLVGYLKILQSEKIGPLSDRQRKVLDAMIQSTERLSRTIDNLSDFAVLETRNYHVRAESLEPVRVLEKLVDELQHDHAKPKRVHISLVSKRPELVVSADPSRFTQAIGNLIENAIQSSPHGGEVLVEVKEVDRRLQVAVYDQGEGVPPEDQARILEPFYHGRGGRQAITAGLRLPVARKIAEAHGGRLTVESPPKLQPDLEHGFSGSKFVFEMPITQVG